MSWTPIDFLFWALALIPLTAVVLYPLVLRVLSLLLPKAVEKEIPAEFPLATLIISAYNEENVIRQKIENSLALDYPAGALEIIVASDGSTDMTNRIVEEYAGRGVRLLASRTNRGKSVLLNEAVEMASSNLLVFSDANSIYSRNAMKELVPWIMNPKVGCVCGRLVYTNAKGSSAARGENLYWNLDATMKTWEGRIGKLVAGNGSIMAVRREVVVELKGKLSNDFVWPVASLYQGYHSVFEPRAVAVESPAGTLAGEFRRKVRIINRGLHVHLFALTELGGLVRKGTSATGRLLLASQMISKKLCRYLMFPSLFAMMLVGPVSNNPITFNVVLGMWAGLILATALTVLHPFGRRVLRPWPDFSYALVIAVAGIMGGVYFLTGKNYRSWGKERSEGAFQSTDVQRVLSRIEAS